MFAALFLVGLRDVRRCSVYSYAVYDRLYETFGVGFRTVVLCGLSGSVVVYEGAGVLVNNGLADHVGTVTCRQFSVWFLGVLIECSFASAAYEGCCGCVRCCYLFLGSGEFICDVVTNDCAPICRVPWEDFRAGNATFRDRVVHQRRLAFLC